jgi:hypothetical protein
MNRIILIRNGFDLAHKMKTSYQDFLNDFCKNIIAEIKAGCIPIGQPYRKKGLVNIGEIPPSWTDPVTSLTFKEDCSTSEGNLTFENTFLDKIFKRLYIKDWVDIENEYYELLKKVIDDDTIYPAKELNSDFQEVKQLLSQYLEKQDDKYQSNSLPDICSHISHIIYSPISIKDLSLNSLTRIPAEELNEIKGQNEIGPDKVIVLNFNYTSTANWYVGLHRSNQYDYNAVRIESYIIQIHGSLNVQDKNPIIFGYGDELDDDYKRIEKLNNNEYLENIKSIKYLETDNYKRLLEFIESDDYQVFTFGHSCGTSDRTLLNTLFEHDNCASIKPFYHKREDGSDNYSDIVRNISRNFNSKVKMRDRVVNKTYCKPLIN